jgi:hypothetical protein
VETEAVADPVETRRKVSAKNGKRTRWRRRRPPARAFRVSKFNGLRIQPIVIGQFPTERPGSLMVLAAVVATVTVFGLLVASQPATAKVVFDPESPAGKEYAIPLDEARNEAAGRSGSVAAPPESAPLFGVGVSAGPPDAPEGDGAAVGIDEVAAEEPVTGGQPPLSEPERKGGAAAPAGVRDPGDGYSASTAVGLVALIVLLGAGLGMGLRGLQRISPE